MKLLWDRHKIKTFTYTKAICYRFNMNMLHGHDTELS